MKHINFYLDFISPYAYLAFEHLPQALEGLSYSVSYKPVLLGAMLKHHGQLGPGEIPAKRIWTYRQVLWLARELGIPLQMPATHPYNPLPHLRLALGTSTDGDISRHVCETILRDIWRGGQEATDPARLAELQARLPRLRDGNGAEAKAQLRTNTDQAIAAGAFGVPAYEVDGELIWGLDGLPMLRALLEGDKWFREEAWIKAAERPGLTRTNR
jgi:2-hydroxychromene-2-carboxylate isomerase